MLAMTHEEAVTNHVAREVRSYRDLPLTLYHFQTKGRDEPRPRAGVLRTREFTMKDAYSFDRDEEGLASVLRHPGRGLQADLRPRRTRVVHGRVRRRNDGRIGRRRIHGSVRRRRERHGARRRATPPTSRSPAPRLRRRSPGPSSTRPKRSHTPGQTTIEQVADGAGRRCRAHCSRRCR